MGRYAQSVLQNDQYPLTLVNYVNQPRLALPTLVSFPQSFAFRDSRPSMVFDANTRTLEEPCANECARAMRFLTSTTCGPNVTESQHRHVLEQAMDLTSMVWFMEICLAAQRYNKGGLEGQLGRMLQTKGQRVLYRRLCKRLSIQMPRCGMIAYKLGSKSLRR